MKKQKFSSKLGIIAAAAGSAVGLGNIWKFSYIAGANGGGAFVLIYILFVIALGYPLMVSEFAIGRSGGENCVDSFANSGKSKSWMLSGILGTITSFVIITFYSVVAGWVVSYLFKSISSNLAKNADASAESFLGLIQNPGQSTLYSVLFFAMVVFVLFFGVQKGIEKVSKFLMPLLFAILLFLAIFNMFGDGFVQGLSFLFKPNFAGITPSTVLAAASQAFFSLSLGMGAMVTYGVYISNKENIKDISVKVSVADTLVAILSGIAIFPIVFSQGLSPSSGPGLVFITLPSLFSNMPFGYVLSILFFLLLLVAALTSGISLLENVVSVFETRLKSRKKSILFVSVPSLVIIYFVAASQAVNSKIALPFLNSFATNLLDQFSNLADWILIPVGAIFTCVYVYLGMKKGIYEKEIGKQSKFLRVWVGLVMPVILCVITYMGLKDNLYMSKAVENVRPDNYVQAAGTFAIIVLVLTLCAVAVMTLLSNKKSSSKENS